MLLVERKDSKKIILKIKIKNRIIHRLRLKYFFVFHLLQALFSTPIKKLYCLLKDHLKNYRRHLD